MLSTKEEINEVKREQNQKIMSQGQKHRMKQGSNQNISLVHNESIYSLNNSLAQSNQKVPQLTIKNKIPFNMHKKYRLSTKAKVSREKDKTIQTQAFSNMQDELKIKENEKAIYLENNTVLSSINVSKNQFNNKTFYLTKDQASILSTNNQKEQILTSKDSSMKRNQNKESSLKRFKVKRDLEDLKPKKLGISTVQPFSQRSKQNKNLNSIGTGIINGPSYISVYNYPVLFFNKRSTSRGQTRRRTKRQTEVTSSPPKNSNNYTVNMNETNVSKYVTDNDPLDQIVSRQDSQIIVTQQTPSQEKTSKDHYERKKESNLNRSNSQQPNQLITNRNQKSVIQSSILGLQSLAQARKLKEQKDIDLRQYQNRIAILQAEEEKALKRIDETRYKAQKILENKIQHEQLNKERQDQKLFALTKAREIVQELKLESENVKIKYQLAQNQRLLEAQTIKEQSKKNKKQLDKMERQYLRKAQEKRFELQVMNEASKIKQEQFLINRIETQKRLKDEMLLKEEKQILKKERQVKKLELLEAEVLKRLKDTHIKQQSAISEIQQIFQKNDMSQLIQTDSLLQNTTHTHNTIDDINLTHDHYSNFKKNNMKTDFQNIKIPKEEQNIKNVKSLQNDEIFDQKILEIQQELNKNIFNQDLIEEEKVDLKTEDEKKESVNIQSNDQTMEKKEITAFSQENSQKFQSVQNRLTSKIDSFETFPQFKQTQVIGQDSAQFSYVKNESTEMINESVNIKKEKIDENKITFSSIIKENLDQQNSITVRDSYMFNKMSSFDNQSDFQNHNI